MPNIYKGFNYDEAKGVINTLKRGLPGLDPDYVNWQTAFNYFKQKKLDAFGYLFRVAFDFDYLHVEIAPKAIKLKEGEIDKETLNKVSNSITLISGKSGEGKKYNKEIQDLQGVFGSSTGGDIGKLAAVVGVATAVFPNPVTGVIAGVLAIVGSVWNLFTSPGKDASFEAKERGEAQRREWSGNTNGFNIEQFGTTENANVLKFLSFWALRHVSIIRPKCVAGTEACELEHFRYAFRADLHRVAQTNLIDIYVRYFNTYNDFKNFIDNYQTIVSQINQIDPTGNSTTFSNNKITGTNLASNSNIGLLLLGALPFLPKLMK